MALTAGYNLQQSQAALGDAELRFVEQMARSTAGRIAQLVADNRHLLRSLGTDSDFAALAQAMDGARSTGHLSYHSTQLGADEIAGYSPVAGSDWVVGVVEPRATFEAPLQRLKTVLGWSVALVGLLFTGLALRFARGIVRPLRGLTAAADALKAGDYAGATVDVKSRDEVGQLGRTFNVMIDVLRQRDRERRRD